MRRLALYLYAVLLLGVAASGAWSDTLHIIELRHRPAAELQPLIRPLLRADEALSGSGYRLFLRAGELRRREIERLIATLDVAARRLTVTLRQNVVRDDRQSRDAVGGEIGVGDRGRIVLPDDAEGQTGGAHGREGLRYRFERRTSAAEQAHTQVVRVQDGQRAFIRVGQSVPAVERVLVLTGRRARVIAENIRYREFATGFDVLPRLRGDTVQLEITPRLSSADRHDDSFRFQELRTTVTARLGQWMDLGAVIGRSSEVSRTILESAKNGTDERISIMLKVE